MTKKVPRILDRRKRTDRYGLVGGTKLYQKSLLSLGHESQSEGNHGGFMVRLKVLPCFVE